MKTFVINLAASGQLVAADTQAIPRKVRLTSLCLIAVSTVAVQFQSGPGTSNLSGVMTLIAGTPLVLPVAPTVPGERCGYLESAPGQSLYLALGSAEQVSGFGTYELVA